MSTLSEDSPLPSIHADDLDTVSGGLFGPADLIIGPLQDQAQHESACAEAKHWEQNARAPGATEGEKAYAKYKRQFCPKRPLDWRSW